MQQLNFELFTELQFYVWQYLFPETLDVNNSIQLFRIIATWLTKSLQFIHNIFIYTMALDNAQNKTKTSLFEIK